MCVRVSRNAAFFPRVNERGRCPSRPEVPRRQSGGGEAGAPGRAVLREEDQRLLHTPEVPASDSPRCLIFNMCQDSSNRLIWIMDTGHHYSHINSCFTLTVALHQTKLHYCLASQVMSSFRVKYV